MSGGGLVALALAVVVLLSAGPITAARLEATAAAPGLVPGLPEASESWRGPLPSAATWRPLYTGPDAELEARYLHGTTDAVEVRVVWYRSQRQGAELINFENRLFDKGLWQEVGETTRAAGANGTNLRVIEKRLRNGQQQLRLWYWYLVGGAHATSETSAKLLEIPAAFREPHVGSALIAIAAREDSGNETAESLLGMFLEQHYAALQRCVTGANEGCQQ